MLVSRSAVLEQSGLSKFEASIHHRHDAKTRMSSNFAAPLSSTTQVDWHGPGQYAFLPSADNSPYVPSYDQAASGLNDPDAQVQSRGGPGSSHGSPKPHPLPTPPALEGDGSQISVVAGSDVVSNSTNTGDIRSRKQPSPNLEQAESQDSQQQSKDEQLQMHHGTMSRSTKSPTAEQSNSDQLFERPQLAATEAAADTTFSSSAGPDSPQQSFDKQSATIGRDDEPMKEDDDDVLNDEDMLDDEVDGEVAAAAEPPMTAAERTAMRRKMKRFRLTHQQTRFLMSEFAKQPHPDAAHRERLSREIPGLSPRQVQVWFQNRRAKIKRLTADDRERMIKMRAVPDDFDNVQALHSPYGAVHGLGTSLGSSVAVGYGALPSADSMIRPLIVDVRANQNGHHAQQPSQQQQQHHHHHHHHHLSPSTLSPAFANIGFQPELLSPLPTSPDSDQYGYAGSLGGPAPPAPLSAGAAPRISNPFARPPGMDSGLQMHRPQAGNPLQPTRPLQLRETMGRPRGDTLQSPLRTSMSWKGDAIDYTTYHSNATSSPPGAGRDASAYHSAAPSPSLGAYESSSSYAGSSVQSPTSMAFSSFPSPSPSALHHNRQPHQNASNPSRLRAAPANLPLGLDARTPFRSVSSGHNMHPPPRSPGSRSGPSSLRTPSSGYSLGFPAAPLTAPVEFVLPRNASFSSTSPDYAIPQMSAPIAPSQDFSQAFHAGINSARTSGHSSTSRTPLRDSFTPGHASHYHGAKSSPPASMHDPPRSARSENLAPDPSLPMRPKRSSGASPTLPTSAPPSTINYAPPP